MEVTPQCLNLPSPILRDTSTIPITRPSLLRLLLLLGKCKTLLGRRPHEHLFRQFTEGHIATYSHTCENENSRTQTYTTHTNKNINKNVINNNKRPLVVLKNHHSNN